MSKNTPKTTIAVDSLGCKLNQAEMESLARQLARAGYKLVSPADRADIYILNSCTVTHIADRKTRQKLRGYHRLNPVARLVVTGCYGQRKPGELETLDGVAMVVGNEKKPDIPRLIKDIGITDGIHPTDSPELNENHRRTRSFIKIQDGCRNFCAYCIVPLVRSRELNIPPDVVIDEIIAREKEGYREVVLTGTEIGRYRYEDICLESLIERILMETGITRIRLSSLQPLEITPELVALWQDSRLCPHFHISLQSGSDSVLTRMKRRYNTGEYRRTVELIRGNVPDVAVTTDVIVGFPGETDAEFRETLDFCREIRFARIHVFPYSTRPGTAAAVMVPKVSNIVQKERSRQVLALAEERSRKYRESYPGREMEVLFEQKSGGFWTGLTGNYIKVYVKSRADLTNRIVLVRLTNIYRDGVRGELL
ncbi:MAG: tRNA (N(6)-L-threonylcarbamoyladenosine(37)-C(2))-methylthiotransferase MtaB [Dehalococcoidia bacterium]|jgi:threonylcarbamoyladenosine tRNA methylthiotransferase MtaB